MFIKNLVSWAGDLFSLSPGEVVEVPEEMGAARIEAGLAEAADVENLPEDAILAGFTFVEHPAAPVAEGEEPLPAPPAEVRVERKRRH